jgi:hypothetical protein
MTTPDPRTLAVLRQMAHDYLDRALSTETAYYAAPQPPDPAATVDAGFCVDDIVTAYGQRSDRGPFHGSAHTPPEVAGRLDRLRADFLARLASTADVHTAPTIPPGAPVAVITPYVVSYGGRPLATGATEDAAGIAAAESGLDHDDPRWADAAECSGPNPEAS